MSNKPDMSDMSDELAIHYAYIFLFGRPPESKAAIKFALEEKNTINVLREKIMVSREYKNFVQLYGVLNKLIENELALRNGLAYTPNSSSSKNLLIMQTSDAERYADMLFESQKYNKKFAIKNDAEYRVFIGIKYGKYPHHAMYNRIHMLQELIDTGYRGWVLYLDADAIVVDKDWKIKEQLEQMRIANKIFLLHPVYEQGDPKYSWHDINTGAFAIDLNANISRSLIRIWSFIYSKYYNYFDYEAAISWEDLINDQSSFSYLLQGFNRHIDIIKHLELIRFQGGKVVQVLRQNDREISPEQEIKNRINALRNMGESVWS